MPDNKVITFDDVEQMLIEKDLDDLDLGQKVELMRFALRYIVLSLESKGFKTPEIIEKILS